MSPEKIPHHVAIIPDGNRTWAKERGLPQYEGHKRGFELFIEIVKKARELGINTLTLWAFSKDNWKRDKSEVAYLMRLYEEMIDRHLPDAIENETRVIHIGKKDDLPTSLAKKIQEVEDKTKDLRRHHLVIALDYGGRPEIIRGVNMWHRQADKDEELTEEEFEKYLYTKDLPHPNVDLLIRTGPKRRLSGYLLWQNEYAELMFTPEKMPDFTPEVFERCIREYGERERTFGGDRVRFSE